MRRRAWAWAAALLLAALPAATAGAAEALTALDRYLDGLHTLRAQFTQRVVDSAGATVEQGQGALLVSRPGRFRWEYTPQDVGAQLLVADGTRLWFYDRELQQATVKPAAAALTATPVVLLSGTVAQMREAFAIADAGARDGLGWVRVTPRDPGADFASAELGFQGTQLLRLVIHDRLNQTVTLSFTRSARNARVSDAELSFTPPAGVDVIGTVPP